MKKTKIIFWIATVIIFLFEGVMPISTLLFAPEYTNLGTKPLGYPDYFAVTLTLFKFAGALALIIPFVHPRLKEWAYAGLTFNLVFAIISHAVVDGNIGFIFLPVVILAILTVSFVCNDKIQARGNLSESVVFENRSIASLA